MQAIGDSCTPPKEHCARAQLQRLPELLEPEEANYEMMFEMLPSVSLTTIAGAEITTMDFTAMDNSTIDSTEYAVINSETANVQGTRYTNAPVELPEFLTPDEERHLHYLERKVESAFYDAGKALAQIRERKLYRGTHKTFEAYCKDRFGFTRRRPYQIIDAASVVDNLCTNGTQNQDELEMSPIRRQILPTNERQVRDLIGLEPDEQREVWQQAVNIADGKAPSGRVVKSIVEKLKEKPLTLASQFCQVGDIFTLTRLEGAERKYNGCSCVAIELKDFTVMVNTYHQTLAVKPDNLNKIDSPDARRELPQILKRIKRLRSQPEFLDRGAYAMLEHLGRQLYLTPLEEKLLRTIEQEYGVRIDTIEES